MRSFLMFSATVLLVLGAAVLLAFGDRGEPQKISGDHAVINEHEAELRGPCYWLGYWTNAYYFWKAPHPDVGDLSYAQRYSVCRPETLMYVDIAIYDDGSGLCGNDDVICTIYDDVGGLPGTVLAQVTIPAGGYVFYPAWTTFDFSAFGLVLDCEFHVAFSSSAAVGGGDYECCLSDEGTRPLNRSSSEWTPGTWVDMFTGWGADVNFLFEVYLCSPDDFEDDHKMHYPQYPDESGWDVHAEDSLVLADDWRCSETGYVKDIHFWGSWKDDSIGIVDSFLLSIHRDIPAWEITGTCYNTGDCNQDGIGLSVSDLVELVRYVNNVPPPRPFYPRYDFDGNCIIDEHDITVYEEYFAIGLPAFDPYGGYPIPTCCRAKPYSRPGDSLWQHVITDFHVIPLWPDIPEGWYEPDSNIFYEENHWRYFRYDVCLPESLWFWQEEDSIYWLNISAYLDEPDSTDWGWKSSYNHWNDDAVWAYNEDHNWQEIYEPGEYLYIPGDVDHDGDVDDDDVTYLQDWIFSGGPPPPFEVDGFYPAADVNGDCLVDLSDIAYLVNYLDAAGPPPMYCALYPPLCRYHTFGAIFDNTGFLTEGWGTDYYDSGWYYYPATEWYNIWFYDHPLDTTRKKVIEITVTLAPVDNQIPSSVTFAVNWSSEFWWSPQGDSMPPLPGEDEELFIRRDILFEGEIIDSITLVYEYVIPDYNPEWVSIDVIATNALVEGGIKHCCIPSLDLAFVITNSRCGESCDCLPGDANGDGVYNILDITYLIDYLYLGGPPPTPYPICSGDANCNCLVNILDITYLIAFLYQNGPPPCDCPTWLQNCGPPLRK